MILVTGARGHIGNVLVKHLYDNGHRDLRLMVQGGDTSFVEPYAKEIVRCDIRDATAVDDAVRGCTDVFHLAGYIHMSGTDKQKLNEINVGGVTNIVNACIKHGVSRLVYVSSIHALIPSAENKIDESVNPDLSLCGDEYSRTKLAGTLIVMDACEHRNLNAVTVFPTGVIGPFDYRSSMTGSMFKKYVGARGTKLCFAGKYDFVDVRDVADGIYRAWQCGKMGEGYILSGEECTISHMIRLIGRCAGRELKTADVPVFVVKAVAGVMDVYYRLAKKTPIITRETIEVMISGVKISNEKAKAELGFFPRSLEETMRDTVEWHCQTTGH
jgi:dihydroflavonol-4-reductase